MPTEMRRIVFTEEELKEAITLYNRVAAQKLPPGLVVGCDLKGNEKVEVVLSISDQSTGDTHSVTLGAAHLGACLIRFCIEKKVPLPRNWAKSLQVIGDSIALNLTRDLSEERLPSERNDGAG